ncbi:MAG: hypothetical protein ACYC6L_05950 [Anaerolineae bacterium]
MKAIFIHTNCILRDSHIDPAIPGDNWRLTPATLEALRRLSGPDQLLIMLDSVIPAVAGDATLSRTQTELIKQVEAGGGRLDALINCPHAEKDPSCRCWGDYPGMLWLPAQQLTLDLPACFVIADQQREISTAYAAGVRPLVILDGRQIVDVVGTAPAHKDFPIAPDLTTAVNYISVEQEIALNLGRQRTEQVPLLPQSTLESSSGALPVLTVTSARLAALQRKQQESRIKLKDLARWLSFFIIGSIGVTLGIAYLLTHLYRVQPFPNFIYWLTLQFIPRVLRGALFIVIGVGIILLAIRGFYRSDIMARLSRRVKSGR